MKLVYALYVDSHLWGIYSTLRKAHKAAWAGIRDDQATMLQAQTLDEYTFQYITDISMWIIKSQIIEVDL